MRARTSGLYDQSNDDDNDDDNNDDDDDDDDDDDNDDDDDDDDDDEGDLYSSITFIRHRMNYGIGREFYISVAKFELVDLGE